MQPTDVFGEKLREQVERKLESLGHEETDEPDKNEDIMEEVMNELKNEQLYFDSETDYKQAARQSRKKAKKAKKAEQEEAEEEPVPKKKKKIAKA